MSRRSRSRSRSRSPSPRRSSRYSPPRRSPPRRGPAYVSDRDLRDSTTLFVGNLPYNFNDRDVADYFSKCGRIRGVTIGMNKRTGQSKGYAFVEYESRRDAEDAYDRFNGYALSGRRLRIDWDVGLGKKQAFFGHVSHRSPPRGGRRSPPSSRRSRSPHRSSRRSRSKSRSRSRSRSRSPSRSRSRSRSGSPRRSPERARHSPVRSPRSPAGSPRQASGDGGRSPSPDRKRSRSPTPRSRSRSPSPGEKRRKLDEEASS